MKVGDTVKPSFALDQAGIEKEMFYKIVEVDDDYAYINTGFKIKFPIHKSKIVEQEVFELDVANYRSKTWAHVTL